MQDRGLGVYSNKTLKEIEQRYSNIEREIFGVVFGYELFHHNVYGRHVIVYTDDKLLKNIMIKTLSTHQYD